MSHQNSVSEAELAQNLSVKPGIKAVIFDLDDTLWPLLPLIESAEQTLYEWLQVQAPKVVINHSVQSMRTLRLALVATNARFQFDLWALRHAALVDLFKQAGADADNALVDAAMQVFAKARSRVSLYADVVPGLMALRQNYQLGTISNGFADLTEAGIAPHFSVSLAAHQFGCAKPDARIFLAACAALNVAPQQAVYVGDDVLCDVQGAQQAGLHSVWMNRHGRPPLPHVQADVECRDLHGLIKWLNAVAE